MDQTDSTQAIISAVKMFLSEQENLLPSGATIGRYETSSWHIAIEMQSEKLG